MFVDVFDMFLLKTIGNCPKIALHIYIYIYVGVYIYICVYTRYRYVCIHLEVNVAEKIDKKMEY